MVALAFSAGEHHVAQIETGEQSEALKALASDIVTLSEGPARLSTTIASAKEGLALIADGRLAPETLTLMAHFKALDGSGWIVEAQDGQLRSAPLDARAGYGSRKQLVQARAHILGLARTFDASGITSLPARLATADYTELQVQVLDKRSEVLARPLTGQSSPTPEQLQALMQIRAALDRMHRLVIKQGRNAP
jgi:hypothetical protein